MKIGIIGMGHVGASLAYALVLKGLCKHLVLASRNEDKARGDALDLIHCLAFCALPMQIEGCGTHKVSGCDIIVVSASTPMSKGMTSRLELAKTNVPMFKELIPVLSRHNPDAVFLIITNPVDVMTYLATQLSGFPANKILGIGTLVDSARFRMLLSKTEQVHPDDLRAYILGEHGPNQFPVFSHALVGGEQIMDTPQHRQIFMQVNNAGFDVYQYKGYTNFAIASATCEVIRSIAFDEHRTMPLSIAFKEWQGIYDNCFSIPVVVGRAGVIRHLHPELNAVEKEALEKTASLVRASIDHFL